MKPEENIHKLFEATIEMALDSIIWMESGGKIINVNNATTEILGWTKVELYKMTVLDFDIGFAWPNFDEFFREVKERKVINFFSTAKTKTNGRIDVDITVFHIKVDNKEYLCGSFRDITVKKASEKKLIENEKLLNAILNHHFQLTGLINSEGILLMANQTALNMLKLTREEVIGKIFWETPWWTHSEKEQNKLKKAIERTAKGNFTRYETKHLDYNGNIRILDFSLTPLFDNDGKVNYIIPEARDITSQIEAKEKLEEALLEVSELKNQLEKENVYLKEEIKYEHNFANMVGRSPKFLHVIEQIQQVASTDSNVLILGETGTGKELIARAIHDLSDRKRRPLVKINCAALPANLIESELFGHEKGAFTGAHLKKIGRFELAHQGTIFLDEIGDIPLELQSKLLRMLQESEFERVGSTNTIQIDVRVIAATNRNLQLLVKEGRFREDLFYRLHVFPIESPPLRERKDDISLLVNHFVKYFNSKMGKNIEIIPQKVQTELINYDWPGNIRELENVIERAVVFSSANKLELGNWFATQKSPSPYIEKLSLNEMNRRYILSVLEEANWKIRGKNGAAEVLDLKPTTLASKMQKLDIKRPNK